MNNTSPEADTTGKAQLTISIAMATYNGAQYIREQLDSIAAQTLLPDELIITDDGSTDETIAIIEGFAKTAPFPVRIYLNEQRLGYSENFLRAASLCSGEIIALSDQDDFWLPEKLMVCASELRNRSVSLCVHSCRIWYGGDNFGGNYPNIKQRKYVQPGLSNPLLHHNGMAIVFRKNLIDLSVAIKRPPDWHSAEKNLQPMAHDEWFWFLGCISGTIVEIPETVAWYRRHSTNTQPMTRHRRSIRDRLKDDKSQQFLNLRDVHIECAATIEAIMARNIFPDPSRQLQLIDSYKKQAMMYDTRKNIYLRKSNFLSRLRAFISISRKGSYSTRRKYSVFNRKAQLKDIFFVFFSI